MNSPELPCRTVRFRNRVEIAEPGFRRPDRLTLRHASIIGIDAHFSRTTMDLTDLQKDHSNGTKLVAELDRTRLSAFPSDTSQIGPPAATLCAPETRAARGPD